MADDWSCIFCAKPIGMWDKTCKYCGEKQFGENDEYYPTEESMNLARQLLQTQQVEAQQMKEKQGFLSRLFRRKTKEPAEPVFTQNEVFFHAFLNKNEDEEYRKFMRVNWFTKNYRE